MTLVTLILRWSVGALLFAAGVGKLMRREEHLEAVGRYRILPTRVAAVVSRSLPYLELALAVALFAGIGLRITAGMVSGMFIAFAAAMALNLRRGEEFDCGCGLQEGGRISWRRVGVAVGVAVVGAVVGAFSPSASAGVRLEAANGLNSAVAIAAALSIVLCLLLLRLAPVVVAASRAEPRIRVWRSNLTRQLLDEQKGRMKG